MEAESHPPFLIAAVGATVLSLSPAHGQVCGDREMYIDFLQTRHNEARAAFGIVANRGVPNGNIVELFQADGGATWTLTITLNDGRLCPLASGEDWQLAPIVKPIMDPGA